MTTPHYDKMTSDNIMGTYLCIMTTPHYDKMHYVNSSIK